LPVVRLSDCVSTRVGSWMIAVKIPLDSHAATPSPSFQRSLCGGPVIGEGQAFGSDRHARYDLRVQRQTRTSISFGASRRTTLLGLGCVWERDWGSNGKSRASGRGPAFLWGGWIRLPVVRLPDCVGTRVGSWTIAVRVPARFSRRHSFPPSDITSPRFLQLPLPPVSFHCQPASSEGNDRLPRIRLRATGLGKPPPARLVDIDSSPFEIRC
jgi:hypothetical protein